AHVSPIVPSLGSDSRRRPLLGRVPSGTVPLRRRSYCGAPTSRCPDRARFLSHGRSRLITGGSETSRVPGQPLACVPCSTTPVEPARRGPGLAALRLDVPVLPSAA